MALSHYLLLSELQTKADEAAKPEPYVIKVGESEYEKAERLRKEEAERKRIEEQRKEAAKRELNRNNSGHSNRNTNSVGASYGRFIATAYTAFCNSGCTGITKTGLDVSNTTQHGGRTIIAVDPAVIPLGSKVSIRLADGRVIEGTAQDTGGAIRGHRIDVLMGSEGQAREFGRQSVKIKVMGAE
ncbi:3D domain-containing protein [Peribacillus simplex]|uniref:3D domain-containing protein n=1 Tax=Peribacillus simplex TaxID=1478 RepID=UPI0034E8F26C